MAQYHVHICDLSNQRNSRIMDNPHHHPPTLLLADNILEDCTAVLFISQQETLIDCIGPTLILKMF